MDKNAKKARSKWVHWLSRIGTTFGLAGLSWLYLSVTGLVGGSFFAGLLCALTSFEFSRNSRPQISPYLSWILTIVSFFVPYLIHRMLLDPNTPVLAITIYEVYLGFFLLITLVSLRWKTVLHMVSKSKLFPLWGITFPLATFIVVAHFFMNLGRTSNQALLWVIMIIFVTKATDIGALLFGSAFGKHKLAPKTSPGKTIEGAIGGVFLSISVALFVFWIAKIDLDSTGTVSTLNQVFKVILTVGLVSITGILGDLFESSWKRHNELKDSGSILPGLGGVYDLTDSIILSSPVAYFLIKFFLIS